MYTSIRPRSVNEKKGGRKSTSITFYLHVVTFFKQFTTHAGLRLSAVSCIAIIYRQSFPPPSYCAAAAVAAAAVSYGRSKVYHTTYEYTKNAMLVALILHIISTPLAPPRDKANHNHRKKQKKNRNTPRVGMKFGVPGQPTRV